MSLSTISLVLSHVLTQLGMGTGVDLYIKYSCFIYFDDNNKMKNELIICFVENKF
jgi:hypothetical protein